MDPFLSKYLNENSSNYKQALNRIIDKYSKFRHDEEYSDVDLNLVDTPTLHKYLRESKKQVCQLESESLTNLSDGSHGGGSAAGHPQDLTHQDCDADESADSISQFSLRANGMSSGDATRLTDGSLDDSRRNFSEVDVQPEDGDEELEMSLSRNGNFMAELYPGMISRLGAAWRRRHASEAAEAVLKRYHRWRQQPKKVNLNKTVVVSRLDDSRGGKASAERRSLRAPLPRQETSSRSPLKMLTAVRSPKAQGSPRSRPILVMEPDSSSDSEMEISPYETFAVSEMSPAKRSRLGERSSYAASSYYSPKKATAVPPPHFRSVSSPARSAHNAACSVCSPKTAAVRARPSVCGSPVRQSPSIARVWSERSPPRFYRQRSAEPRDPMRPRSFSATLSSPSRWLGVKQSPLRSPRPTHPAPGSPRPAASALSRLRRRLSVDSFLASMDDSLSSQHLDTKIQTLYHQYVCERKWMFPRAAPCHECRERAQARLGHTSILSALALSPHCSVQRKRFREQGGGGGTCKRLKEEWGSPGSARRELNQMLRRRLCPEEFEPRGGGGGGGLRSSHGGSQRFSSQQDYFTTLH